MLRIRADRLLVERGLAPSLEQAARLIMAGRVRTPTRTLVQPGTLLPPDEPVELVAQRRFVSRGGEKLAGALDAFAIDPGGLRCLDLGASTGGFTDCLLQRGAAHVIAVDNGKGVLHASLRNDTRVTVLEGIDARALPDLPPVDLFVADLSFARLVDVLPHVAARLAPATPGVVLLKPQYEAQPADVPPDGVIRDAALRAAVLDGFQRWLEAQSWTCLAVAESAITGDKGNVEYVVHLKTPGGHRAC